MPLELGEVDQPTAHRGERSTSNFGSLETGLPPTHLQRQGDPGALQAIAARISVKLEEGDFRGAVRLACSEDSVAEASTATIAALKSKHPAAHLNTTLPPPPEEEALKAALVVSEREVTKALHSFPRGSAGGADGLRPQHLLDMTSMTAGAGGGAIAACTDALHKFCA